MYKKTLNLLLLKNGDYHQTYRLQQHLVQKRIDEQLEDTLILVEHPPVITIGRGGSLENLLLSNDQLKKEGIEVLEMDRGGDITYHGPGQLVGYPILDLKNHQQDLHWVLRSYEQIFIELLSIYGLQGERLKGFSGVWVFKEKIMAVGIGVKRWVTFHGFSFNLDPTLAHFQYIIPCGIKDKGVTSLRRLLGDITPNQEEVIETLVEIFLKVFSFNRLKRIDEGEVWG